MTEDIKTTREDIKTTEIILENSFYKVRVTRLRLDGGFLYFGGKVIDKNPDKEHTNKECNFGDYTDLSDFTWDVYKLSREKELEK